MKRMIRVRFIAVCFMALLTALTLFTALSARASAEPIPQDVAQPKTSSGSPPSAPPDQTDAGGGVASLAVFLVGAAGILALQKGLKTRRS